MKVIGIKKVSYNRKSDGQHIEGMEIHYSYISKNIDGEGVETAFVGQTVIENEGGIVPVPGDEIDLSYNRFGRVTGYTIK